MQKQKEQTGVTAKVSCCVKHINPQERSVIGYTQGQLLVLWAYLK